MGRFPKTLLIALVCLFSFSCGGSISPKGQTEQSQVKVKTVTVDLAGSVDALNRGEGEKLTGAKVKLIVDFNGNGVFEGKHSQDKIFQSATLNGVFFLKGVEIPERGALAELIVEKEGYAPYYKVLRLSKESSLNVKVTLLPVFKKVVPVVRSPYPTRGLPVKFPDGLEVDFSPTDIEEDTSLLSVFGKSFSLPAEIGEVPGISRSDNSLEFLSLAFLELKNQRGEEVEFTDESTCPYTLRLKLSPMAVEKIKEAGDRNKREKGCQVPVYSFTPSNPRWTFLEEGTVVDSFGNRVSCDSIEEGKEYSVEFCGSKEEGATFLAVAYPVKERKQELCFVVEDDEGEPIPGVYFEAVKGGYYSSSTSDDKGLVTLKVPLKKGVPCSSLPQALSQEGISVKYFDPSFSSAIVPLDLSSLQVKSSKACSCLFEVKLPISKTEAVVVARDATGNPAVGAKVCLMESDFRYYSCKKTDQDGIASFKVVPGRFYTASGPGLSVLSKRVSAVDRFFSLSSANNRPEVELEVFPKRVKAGDFVYVFLYAYDGDGDEIRLRNFTCAGKRVRIIEGEDYEGALFVTGYCQVDTPGDYTVSAQVGDAFEMFTVEKAFSVVSGSSPPVFYGYNFFTESGKVIPQDSLKVGENYKLLFYAFDPDGDPIVYRSNTPYCTFEGEGIALCNFPSAGSYTLSFTIDDRRGNDVEVSIPVHVTLDGGLKFVSFSVEPSQITQGEPIKVSAVVYSVGSVTPTASLYVDGRALVPEEPCRKIAEGYFDCSLEATPDLTEGAHTVSLTVQGESSVLSKSSTLIAGVSNLPPKILLPLPLKLQAEVGVPLTFNVKALDPDGDRLSYRWFINGREVSSGKDHLRYTFDASGVYKVEVLVSDGKSVAYSSSEVTAVNLDAGRQFIVHFGAEGVYGILYSDDYSYVDSRVSGSMGSVYFGKLPSSGLNFAVVIPPDVIVPEDVTFKYLVSSILKEACLSGDCRELKEKARYWMAVKEIPVNELRSWRSKVEDFNSDGFVDREEVYRSFVSLFDSDRDGKVSFKEVTGENKLKVFVIKNVKGQQYFLNDAVEAFFETMMPYSIKENEDVKVTVENVPADLSLTVIGGEGNCLNDGTNVVCDVSVPLQDNGLYSFILEDSSGKTYTVKDYDTSSFIVDYSNFVTSKDIEVVGFEPYESLELFASFEGRNYQLSTFSEDGTYSVPKHSFGSGYYANYVYRRDYETYSKAKWVNNFYVGDTLPDYIKVDQLRGEVLNVDLIYHPNDREVLLTGVDVSNLNEIDVYEYCSSTGNSFEFSMEGELDGEDIVKLPHFERILPSNLLEEVNSACFSEGANHFIEITVKETSKDGLEKAFYLKKILQ